MNGYVLPRAYILDRMVIINVGDHYMQVFVGVVY